MAKVYVTRNIPESGIALLTNAGHDVAISEKEGILTHEELLDALKRENPDAVVCLLTDSIDAEVFNAAPNAKIFANYAVGYGNIDIDAARQRGIIVTNTPGVLTDTVAEHTIAMMLSITSRISEGDRFVRSGKYEGWGPMLLLGTDMKGKTLGVLGAGRIGSRVAEIASRGLGMHIAYFDVEESDFLKNELGATFYATSDELLRNADVVSVHVPLMDTTRHLINTERLALMKPSAYLVNSSRGPVIDEDALVAALQAGRIRGAALDVFEHEPQLTAGLTELENVILTPHIGSATEETRSNMAEMSARSVISFLKGEVPDNRVS